MLMSNISPYLKPNTVFHTGFSTSSHEQVSYLTLDMTNTQCHISTELRVIVIFEYFQFLAVLIISNICLSCCHVSFLCSCNCTDMPTPIRDGVYFYYIFQGLLNFIIPDVAFPLFQFGYTYTDLIWTRFLLEWEKGKRKISQHFLDCVGFMSQRNLKEWNLLRPPFACVWPHNLSGLS